MGINKSGRKGKSFQIHYLKFTFHWNRRSNLYDSFSFNKYIAEKGRLTASVINFRIFNQCFFHIQPSLSVYYHNPTEITNKTTAIGGLDFPQLPSSIRPETEYSSDTEFGKQKAVIVNPL